MSRFGVEDVEVSKKLLLGRFSLELVRSLPFNRLNAGSICRDSNKLRYFSITVVIRNKASKSAIISLERPNKGKIALFEPRNVL